MTDKLDEEIAKIREAIAEKNAERDARKPPELREGKSDMVHRVPKVTFPKIQSDQWAAASAPTLRWFECEHLPEYLQMTSKLFETLATTLAGTLHPGPERTIALRKLLEAKDAAVRATIVPGG